MENVATHQSKGPEGPKKELEASVITMSGAYPKKGKKKVKTADLVSEFLADAQKHLHLTDTTGWIATVDGREINPTQTFAQNGLHDTAVLQWGPPHSGGG